MHPSMRQGVGTALVVLGLTFATLFPVRALGDEPSRLGRLFRFGSGSSTSPTTPSAPAPIASATAPVTPTAPDLGTPPLRIAPKPRVSRPVTEADPIVTRTWLVQSTDGSQFGQFMQVFADGTIIDVSGVHHVSREAIKPLMDALQSNDLYHQKGHCGAPATDFVEQVHLVLYERSLGRLRAHAFSHSGNTQGCDPAVHHLNKVLEDLQTKISPPLPASAMGPGSGTNPNAPTLHGAPLPTQPAITIPLSPGD